jgi:hypothetical protein
VLKAMIPRTSTSCHVAFVAVARIFSQVGWWWGVMTLWCVCIGYFGGEFQY